MTCIGIVKYNFRIMILDSCLETKRNERVNEEIAYLGLFNFHWCFTGRHEPKFPLRRIVRTDRGDKRSSVKIVVALLIWIHFAVYYGRTHERLVAERLKMRCICQMGHHLWFGS